MQYTFFDETNRLEKISKLGDVLEQLNNIVNWNIFAPVLNKAIPRTDNSHGGRPPFDNLLMFKILVIKRLYGLSYDQTEYQITVRIDFMRFLNMDIASRVPDAKTEAPKRKNTKEQREILKNVEIPDEWNDEKYFQKLSQRDTDATRAKKKDEVHFGYKDHIKAGKYSKFIVDYEVTTASTSDVKGAENLPKSGDGEFYADAAYPSLKLPEDVKNCIFEKANRNHPLTDEQKANNHKKAKTRCRVEHIFAGMVKMCGGTFVRSKSLKRNVFGISMLNLVYNMRRLLSLENPTKNYTCFVSFLC